MADADQVTVKYVVESTYGVTPTDSSNWKYLRITGENLTAEPVTEESEELPGTQKGVVDVVNNGQTVGGDIPFEFSAATFDDMLEAALGGTWTTNVLTDGNTERSFTFEKNYPDISQFIAYKGETVNSLSLSMQKKTKISGSVGFTGAQAVTSGTSLVGLGSVAAVNEKPIFRTGSTVTNVQIDDTNISALGVRLHGVDLSIAVGTEPEDTVDANFASGVSTNDLKITLSISAYFDNLEIYNRIINTTAFKFEITVADSDGNSYAFVFPRCKFLSGTPDGASKGSAINISGEAVATADKTAGYAIQVTRTLV